MSADRCSDALWRSAHTQAEGIAPMELRRYGPIVRRWLWLIVIALIVSAAASFLFARSQTEIFESRIRIIVGPTLSSQDSSFDVLRASSQLVLTYRELVTTPSILDTTIDRLGLAETRGDLERNISVSSNDVTRLLTIRVQHRDPEQAALIANTLGEVLIARNGSQQASDESQLTIVDAAEPGDSPVSPNVPLIVTLGVLTGLLVAAFIIALVELLRREVKTERDVHDIVRAPSLGSFRVRPTNVRNDPFFANDDGQHPLPESYALAARKVLAAAGNVSDGHTILVCAAHRTPLSSEVSAYLAASVAQSGLASLLIDADLSSRSLTTFFGLNGGPGFANLVSGWEPGSRRPGNTADSIRQMRIALHAPRAFPALFVVPSGSPEAMRTSPERLLSTVEALGRIPAVTIVSGPPMADHADALVLAQAADTVVLVSVAGETRAAQLEDAVENLKLVGATRVWSMLVHLSWRDRLRRRWPRRKSLRPQLVESNMTLEGAHRTPVPASIVA